MATACYHLDDSELDDLSPHATSAHHPETPGRVNFCVAALTANGLWSSLKTLPAREASYVELCRCHSPRYICGLASAATASSLAGHPLWLPRNCALDLDGMDAEKLSKYSKPGWETYVTSSSLKAARLAAGGLLALVDECCLSGFNRRGIAFCRPPGHHAGRSRSDGFCLVNNVAVAAGHSLAVHSNVIQRVLILDWDVHHGQGTQDIFWSDPDVLYVSIHQFEPGFYPGSGAAEEVGSGDGLGFTVNVALPSGFTDCCLWTACAQILLPAAKRFKPDLIIVSAGFDATAADPMGGALCSPRIFGHLTSELCALADSLCCGRLLIALEGGYEAQSLMQCVAEVTQALISSAAEVVGDVDGPGPFGSRPAWLKEPLAGSVSAILDTRAAHANLPLQLM